MNKLDLLLIAYVGLYTFFTFRRGFIRLTLELIGLVASIAAALALYTHAAALIQASFHTPGTFAKAVGFTVVLILAEAVIFLLFRLFGHLIPEAISGSAINRWLGLLPAATHAVMVAAILLTVANGLPLPASARDSIRHSAIASPLVGRTEQTANRIFGGAIRDLLTTFTVEPSSDERVELGFTATRVKVDEAAEVRLLELLNRERTSRGLSSLSLDRGPLRDVARAHSRDMLAHGYFAHQGLDGRSPFDRMRAGGVDFLAAGENLAFAPDVEIAHRGLMNSPPHKKNILDPDFHRVGIGVLSAGWRGEMFTQDFTN